MKHLLKTALSGAAACALCAGLGLSALAYAPDDAAKKADALNTLTLFKGSDVGYELEKPLDRMEALIMLIRLSGAEWDALYPDAPFTHPFTDAPDWEGAEKYIGYAYENGLTAGVTETTFVPEARADLRTYVTFALRALGYDAQSAWDNWETLATAAGILPESIDRENFLRGDAVVIAHAALDAKMADEDITLKEKLLADGVFSEFTLAVATASDAVTSDSALMDIMGTLYAAAAPDLASRLNTTVIDKENITFFLGADAESIGFVEGLACEPMMTSSAHSVCLARVEEGTDVEAAKKAIREKVNPRKWICVGVAPQNVRVENVGNLILLVMDNSAPDAFANRFREMDETLLTPNENGMLVSDGRYVEADEAVNAASVSRFAEKLITLKETYFPENKAYYATIPEKSYFLRDKTTHFLNHDTIAAMLDEELYYGWSGSIDLASALSLDDYYNTDRHWRQERLFPVVDKLGEAMGFTVDKTAFIEHTHENFRGAYQKAVPDIAAETLTWLTSPITDGATVKDFQHPKATAVYDESKLTAKEPYDIFLSGATPLTTITNPNAAEKRRLIVFRDSYGSSLAPLLLPAYSEITLVDLRYMASSLLGDYVDFTDAEVLFLFSDKVVNNSVMLK